LKKKNEIEKKGIKHLKNHLILLDRIEIKFNPNSFMSLHKEYKKEYNLILNYSLKPHHI
jgi:hypothetical protein